MTKTCKDGIALQLAYRAVGLPYRLRLSASN